MKALTFWVLCFFIRFFLIIRFFSIFLQQNQQIMDK